MSKKSKKHIKFIEHAKDLLDNNEEILYSVFGAYETEMLGQDTIRNGIFLATNKRLFFYGKKLTGYNSESFPYSNISSFEASKNLMGYQFKFFASGNKVTIKWISEGDIEDFISYVRNNSGKQDNDTSNVNTQSNNKSIASELRELAKLRDEGVLTDEEFQKEKEKLLTSH